MAFVPDNRTHAEHAPVERRPTHHAPAGNRRTIKITLIELSRGKNVRIVIDGVILVVEVEMKELRRSIEDWPRKTSVPYQCLPNIRQTREIACPCRRPGRNNLLAEVGGISRQSFEHGVGVEDVYAHGCKTTVVTAVLRFQFRRNQSLDDLGVGGLFDKIHDFRLVSHSEQTQSGCLGQSNWFCGNPLAAFRSKCSATIFEKSIR